MSVVLISAHSGVEKKLVYGEKKAGPQGELSVLPLQVAQEEAQARLRQLIVEVEEVLKNKRKGKAKKGPKRKKKKN